MNNIFSRDCKGVTFTKNAKLPNEHDGHFAILHLGVV